MSEARLASSAGAGAGAGAGASTSSASEKTATSVKRRSCQLCRTRKVRCDQELPCANCRRANVACIILPTTRPPRWARRLERIANNTSASNTQLSQDANADSDLATTPVIKRLQNLESLVKELSGQLASSTHTYPEGIGNENDTSADTSSNDGNALREQWVAPGLGDDANRSRYTFSGDFWSRVNDELDGLKMNSRCLQGADDSDTSEDESLPAASHFLSLAQADDPIHTALSHHSFLFRLNPKLSGINLDEYHPLPPQRSFLLDVFCENVCIIIRVVHIPTVTTMIHNFRGSSIRNIAPSTEALLFSIYYAAIVSMEDEDVVTNFGSSRADLMMKYRFGVESALAKADVFNSPDLVVVQAFTIFLFLARRNDSSSFVWMMAGLVIRMAKALGLHRDGADFKHLSPYEIEMRRRAWWAIYMLDLRSSEDQGVECTIEPGSFNVKLPLNINDADFNSNTIEMPASREGITDMTFPLVLMRLGKILGQITALSDRESVLRIEEQSRLVTGIYRIVDEGYLQYSSGSDDIVRWVGVTIARLLAAKMSLFIYLPSITSSPRKHMSDKMKTNLLVTAIEAVEYNHALMSEQACRHWRWYTHSNTQWYAVVYILIEISRRPWSPNVERAWVALHSQWLVPAQSHLAKNLRVWVPLRKLMARASRYRNAELKRLRSDPQAAEYMAREDQEQVPVPASYESFQARSMYNAVESFRKRWHQLLAMPDEAMAQDSWTPGFAPTETHSAGVPGSNRPDFQASIVQNDNSPPLPLDMPGYDLDEFQKFSVQTHVPGGFAHVEHMPRQPYDYALAPDFPTGWPLSPDIVNPWPWANDADAADESTRAFAKLMEINEIEIDEIPNGNLE